MGFGFQPSVLESGTIELLEEHDYVLGLFNPFLQSLVDGVFGDYPIELCSLLLFQFYITLLKSLDNANVAVPIILYILEVEYLLLL